ncbi:amino acid ABC transporter permease [Aestuariirhabdus sp. LZHN29]|uniref:amino acid ABC transporter permease n=1 Tax=Aestuariirhabdus sp. LZHN29 TaxID=3417462 RepID=UPI003CED5E93
MKNSGQIQLGWTSQSQRWLKQNLFSTPLNTIITLICVYILYKGGGALLSWALIEATWIPDPKACKAGAGACWGFIAEKHRYILFGTYPYDEQWRPLVAMLAFVSLICASLHKSFWKIWLLPLWIVTLIGLGIIMWGGVFGLSYVENSLWGGLPLTLLLAVIGTICAFPLGIFLALGRRSHMPMIRVICVGFIELVRGVPLISVLFMASVMFPLFLPEGVTIDKLLRAQVGIILFTAAYLAEVFRGGLQAIPSGQYEAAEGLALSYWQSMRKIILPQALRLVIPPTVNSFISMFKDTSLVIIIGLFDLLATTKGAIKDPQWRAFYVEGYVFTAALFFIFCYSMARYSEYLEKDLKKGYSH